MKYFRLEMKEQEVGTEERGRYDLYIVSENLQQEEEEEEEEAGGHTNQSFTLQEPEEVKEEEAGEINYTALSRATTAIVRSPNYK